MPVVQLLPLLATVQLDPNLALKLSCSSEFAARKMQPVAPCKPRTRSEFPKLSLYIFLTTNYLVYITYLFNYLNSFNLIIFGIFLSQD